MGASLEIREWILGWEQFSPQVRQQILDIIVMGTCGLVIGAFRTVDILALDRWKTGAVTSWLLEVLFWGLAAFCASEFLYYCAYGALSFHGIVSMVLGFYLWKRMFHQEIVSFTRQVFGRQNSPRWSIIKRSMNTGETIGEKVYGKDETKPFLQERARKQRHRYR